MNTEHKNAPRPSDGGQVEPQKVLLLASYCGNDGASDPPCSDWRPCLDCMQMCNVAFADVLEVLGGFDCLEWDKPSQISRSAGGDVVERASDEKLLGRAKNMFLDHPGLAWPELMCHFAEQETAQLRAEVERLREKNEGAREVIEHCVRPAADKGTETFKLATAWLAANPVKEEKDVS